MDKQLLRNLTEYREWAWKIHEDKDKEHIDEALGLCPIYDCFDSILNENGEWIDVDEDGNVIPEDTAETVKLEDWVYGLEFPVIAVYWFQKDDWRGCSHEIAALDFVSLNEFSLVEA